MQLIETSLVVALVAALFGCATTETDFPGCSQLDCIALGEAVELGRYTGDLSVKPFEVLEDSRCPIEADCVWAGRVRVKTELQMGDEVITVDLDSSEPLRIDKGMLSIGEIAPDASVERSPIPPAAYRFGFLFAPDLMEGSALN